MPAPVDAPSGFRGSFRTDAAARAVYSEAAGIARAMPGAVAVPESPDDVARLVEWARAGGRALIPRGSGSSMAGGAVGEAVVVDLSRLRRLHDPDVTSRRVRAEVGVTRGEVQRAAASVGLRFPVDPSSGEFCTIGGMAGTNAAGPHTLRYGPMRPYVLALDCVFDDGTRATVRRGDPPPSRVAAVQRFLTEVHPQLMDVAPEHRDVLKDSSGYGVAAYAEHRELVDLLVGSEGTLCVFTAVEVALIPAPGATASFFVAFADLGQAVEAAVAARAAGASACELLDRTFLEIAEQGGKPLPAAEGADAALLVEVEADTTPAAAAHAERLAEIMRGLGAQGHVAAVGPEREPELWAFRHAASPALARLDPALRSMQFIEDAAVPPARLAEYVRGVRDALRRAEVRGVIFGHAGDAHVHVNPLIDVRQADWRARVEQILDDVTALTAALGGTTTGEHGDGRLRTPLMSRVWSDAARARFAAIKRAFDPGNVFNPGVKVPAPGQRAIDAVKYDPALAPLPPAARRVLDLVERERAYARHRLTLLDSRQ